MLYPELKTKGKEYFKELGLVDEYVLISNQELISDMDKLHRYFVEATLKRYPNNYDEREVLLEAMERLKLEKTKEQETPEVADSDER